MHLRRINIHCSVNLKRGFLGHYSFQWQNSFTFPDKRSFFFFPFFSFAETKKPAWSEKKMEDFPGSHAVRSFNQLSSQTFSKWVAPEGENSCRWLHNTIYEIVWVPANCLHRHISDKVTLKGENLSTRYYDSTHNHWEGCPKSCKSPFTTINLTGSNIYLCLLVKTQGL